MIPGLFWLRLFLKSFQHHTLEGVFAQSEKASPSSTGLAYLGVYTISFYYSGDSTPVINIKPTKPIRILAIQAAIIGCQNSALPMARLKECTT